jgi:hypothetical protein
LVKTIRGNVVSQCCTHLREIPRQTLRSCSRHSEEESLEELVARLYEQEERSNTSP